MSDEAPSLVALDEQMRATRAAIDEEQGNPPRAVTGWMALWSTTRYDDDGTSIFGWTYACDPNADPLRILGTLDMARREMLGAVEGDDTFHEDDDD